MQRIFGRILEQTVLVSPAVVLEETVLGPAEIRPSDKAGRHARRFTIHYPGGLKERIVVKESADHLVCSRSFRNDTGKTLRFKEFRLRLENLDFRGPTREDYFFHAENPRVYGKYCLRVDTVRTTEMVAGDTSYSHDAGTKWADPGTVSDRIGTSPYQPFPAIALGNLRSSRGLVHGSLSQRRFFHNYLVGHQKKGVCLDILSSAKGVSYLEVPPGVEISDELSYLGTTDTLDLQKVFAPYVRALEKHIGRLMGATDINRHSVIWGSWNDGIRENIDEEALLKQAAFLARELPTVKWIQIDNGYAKLAKRDTTCHPHGLGMPYEGDRGVDQEKFPRGLKSYAEKVKKTGLRPALWIGGVVPTKAPLYREHPDWFLDYSYRLGDSPKDAVLDVSVPEVRDYLQQALDYYLERCGFEGVKLDFWSYAFEDSHDLLKHRNGTGYDWRNWLLSECRRRLPRTGYFQTGCDIVMGNPFLGRQFTNYRYGIDIGVGIWDHVRTNAQWAAFCLLTHTGHLFVPNSDSIGLFPGLNDQEALTCINFCLVTRTLVEVSGWLYRQPDHPRMAWVKKALCCPNNGEDVYFAGFDFRRSDEPPPVWYFRGCHFSRLRSTASLPERTVGVFNWTNAQKEFALTPGQIGLTGKNYLLTDVWTGQTKRLVPGTRIRLKPHASTLLSVNRTDGTGPGILDANIRISSVKRTDSTLTVRVAHPGELDLVVDRPVRAVAGISRKQRISPGQGNWHVFCTIDKPDTLKIHF